MGNITFRKAELTDLPKLKEIYTYYIENSTATFHIGQISDEDMQGIIFKKDSLYETFVIEENKDILGYVLLAPYNTREAYRRTAEVTIYLKNGIEGRGVGTTSVNFIEGVAKEKGIKSLLALISGENTGSMRLFEKNGYFKCAHMKNVGEKFGRLLDAVMYEKEI